jgi:integrase/recombinase XerC
MARQAEQLSLFEADTCASRPGSRATPRPQRRRVLRIGHRNPASPAEAGNRQSGTPANGDDPIAVLASYLSQLEPAGRRGLNETELRQARNDWLRRLEAGRRGTSSLTAYRIAIDDLLDWSAEHRRDVFEEATIVDYLAEYQRRARPAPATYYRRFGLLRRFLRWLSRRNGLPDPFLELEPPPKPQQEADWLTQDEFSRLRTAAEHPRRKRSGIADRDRLVLLTLVQTGLRRAEMIALNWSDLELDGPRPSLLVRCGKGGKPRRQPLAAPLAEELGRLRAKRDAPADAPVFCGLEGKRLQPTILAAIIRRAAEGAGLEKRVTAHTLRHTAATWLRQQTGDARLVAAYLGHADLSTVSRYAHVAGDELHEAAATLAGLSAAADAASLGGAGRDDAGQCPGARAERFQRDRRSAA